MSLSNLIKRLQDIMRKDSGVDDRSLFGFDQGDGNLRAEGEQVLSDQAMGQCPIIG